MFVVAMFFKFEHPDFKSLSNRGHRRITKEGFTAAGLHWKEVMLPRHFKRNAKDRYGHQKRSEKYQTRKEAAAAGRQTIKNKAGQRIPVVKGGTVDLVLSGDSETAIKQTARVRGFPKRATVDMLAPKYFGIKFKSRPNMIDELTTVRKQEETKLQSIALEAANKQLKKELKSKRRTTQAGKKR